MRSMFALQPHLLVTTEHGVVTRRLEILTFSTSSREDVLPPLGEVLEHLADLLVALLLRVVGVAELEVLLAGVAELVLVELGEILHRVLVDRVGEVNHLEVLREEALQEGRLLERLPGLAGEVVDGLLPGLHALDVLLQGDELLGSWTCRSASASRAWCGSTRPR